MLLWCSGGNGGTEWDGRQDYISSQQFQELKDFIVFFQLINICCILSNFVKFS